MNALFVLIFTCGGALAVGRGLDLALWTDWNTGLCTAGSGWYQEEGKPAVSLHEGSLVMIPAEVKHWHGAKKDSWFSHIAVEIPGEECRNEWCEPVSDEAYSKL